MTNKTITPEILLAVANGVEAKSKNREWRIAVNTNLTPIYEPDCPKEDWDDPISGVYLYDTQGNKFFSNKYNPQCALNGTCDTQQLRIRDFLAEKGVYIVKIGTNYSARKFWGGNEIATSKNINVCAILAAYEIIKGGV